MTWHPIDTLPDGKEAILFQPEDEEHFRRSGMIVGSLERKGWEKHDPPFWVNPSNVGGHEFECDITHPTHWMEKPDAPIVQPGASVKTR